MSVTKWRQQGFHASKMEAIERAGVLSVPLGDLDAGYGWYVPDGKGGWIPCDETGKLTSKERKE